MATQTIERTRGIQNPYRREEAPTLSKFVYGAGHYDDSSNVASVTRKSVLVVEDDPLYRHLIAEVLSEECYQVFVAENGEMALAIADDSEFSNIDLLVTDIVMPYLDGIRLSEMLLAMRPRTKTLFVSAYAVDYCFEGPMLNRGTGFLSKPFTTDQLMETVKLVLGGQ